MEPEKIQRNFINFSPSKQKCDEEIQLTAVAIETVCRVVWELEIVGKFSHESFLIKKYIKS